MHTPYCGAVRLFALLAFAPILGAAAFVASAWQAPDPVLAANLRFLINIEDPAAVEMNLVNTDIGIDPELPTTYDVDRTEVESVPGPAVPEEAQGQPFRHHLPSVGESYTRFRDNGYRTVAQEPLSTMSTDVNTASYSNVRRFLHAGQRPPADAVRIAELVNYFPYDYPAPNGQHPIRLLPEIAPCPWQPKHVLLRVALQAKTIPAHKLPPRNLVFLVDVSGSMGPENRLPLFKQALRLLTEQLTDRDRVSIVTYAGYSCLALDTTPGHHKGLILEAIERLGAGGSTNGSGGILQAYAQAAKGFLPNGTNRVILGTDGDFNVGVTSENELVTLIEQQRKTGVYLSVLGFGMGNLKDATLEKLARHGDGQYAYIDTFAEARKLFVEQGGCLTTVAKDVKVQIEFNPNRVAAYRLIGYENRVLNTEDFKDDKKDAGDMGAGHTVTVLYELIPAGMSVPTATGEPLKYQPVLAAPKDGHGEWLTLKARYKQPQGQTSTEMSVAVPAEAGKGELVGEFRFAAAVAAFGLVVRDSPYRGTASYDLARALAETSRGADVAGHRAEFVRLIELARSCR